MFSFDPIAEPGIFALPFREPLGDVATHLGEIAPVVDPAQLLQAVIIDPRLRGGRLLRDT